MTSAFLTGLFLQLSLSGLFSETAYLGGAQSSVSGFYPVLFLLYGPVIYIINNLFLRKDRSYSSIIYLNGSLGAALSVGALFLNGHFTFWNILIILALSGILTGCAVMVNIKEPSLRVILLDLEVCALILIIFAVLVSFAHADPVWIFPGVLGIACALISLILKRMGRIPAARDIILIAGMVFIVIAISAVFVIFGAAPAGNGLVSLCNLIASGARQVWKLISRLFELLSRGSDHEPIEPIDTDITGGGSSENDINYFEGSPVGLIAFIIFGVMVLAAIILIIRLIGKHKTHGKHTVSVNRTQLRSSRPSLKEALKKLLERYRLRRLRRRYLKEHADEPLGLYYRIELILKHSSNRKLTGESPRQFITRLKELYIAASLGQTPENSRNKTSLSEDKNAACRLFESFADCVDKSMFGGDGTSDTFTDASVLIKIVSSLK